MATPTVEKTKPKHLNDGLDISRFNYDKEGGFKGRDFSEYLDIVEGPIIDEDADVLKRQGGLKLEQQYRFDVYSVKPKFKKRYPGVPNSPKVLDGFELVKSKPKRAGITIAWKHARLLNEQLHAQIGGGDLPIDYYLLEKI